jgi:hypothetical protein
MTRLTVTKKEEVKQLNPMWRGIGCLLSVAIFITSFLLSSWFITVVTDRANPPALPKQLSFLPSALRGMTAQFKGVVPWFGIGQYIPALFIALVVSIIMFGLISLIYVIIFGERADPREVRKFAPPGLKKRRTRRCR